MADYDILHPTMTDAQVTENQKNGQDKKNAPPPPDYTGAAEKTAQQNRPNQVNANGSQITWTIGPDGRPVQSQSFGGPLAGANTALQGQLANEYSTPFDMSKIPGLTSGAAARDQAINGAYSQATSRLDPQFAQREEQLRTQLLNQGLDPGSEAYQTQMANFGRDRNDAYSSAMNGAIGQGTAAGQAIFNQSLAGHQTGMTDALTKRGLPGQELAGMQGFLQQPGFQSGADYLGAAGLTDAAGFRNWQAHNQAEANAYGAGFQALGALGSLGTGVPFNFGGGGGNVMNEIDPATGLYRTAPIDWSY
jgi:hypothetical protein